MKGKTLTFTALLVQDPGTVSVGSVVGMKDVQWLLCNSLLGQKFAMLELKATVSKVLRNFELLSVQPEHKLKLAPEAILISKNGIRVSLKRRTGLK